jgi:hypothetical protein
MMEIKGATSTPAQAALVISVNTREARFLVFHFELGDDMTAVVVAGTGDDGEDRARPFVGSFMVEE